MVLFDSLNRNFLPNYGGGFSLPNFERLARHTITFDASYVGSLPCMPARRELHTGRLNFLHRGWGPLEPFDDSMPELLFRHGIHTHLSTDHYHYLEDGGATYQGRYTTWDCARGQEGDHWKGSAAPITDQAPHMLTMDFPRETARRMKLYKAHQDDVNRSFIREEADFPQSKTFEDGLDFIRRNACYDNWFLQIETFDPHEPFFSPDHYQEEVFAGETPCTPDWPPYAPVKQPSETVDQMRKKYAALLKMCDRNLGRVLDEMDAHDLWKDTMLIVNTDHGLMIGDHGWWGKSVMPDYEEISHIPLFLWDPRVGKRGVRSNILTQTIDLAPTLLDFFGVPIPQDMQGQVLRDVLEGKTGGRRYLLFGYHASSLNITDGRYVYQRSVQDSSVQAYEYTLMPTHMNMRFRPEELQKAQLREPFAFTKGCPVLKIPALHLSPKAGTDALYDLEKDPEQQAPIHDAAIEKRMLDAMVQLMRQNDAPQELYQRFRL